MFGSKSMFLWCFFIMAHYILILLLAKQILLDPIDLLVWAVGWTEEIQMET